MPPPLCTGTHEAPLTGQADSPMFVCTAKAEWHKSREQGGVDNKAAGGASEVRLCAIKLRGRRVITKGCYNYAGSKSVKANQ